MKKLLLLLAFVFIVNWVSAQTKGTSKLSVGVEFAFPTKTFGSYDFGIGGSLIYQYAVADNLYLTANAGYVSYHQDLMIIGMSGGPFVLTTGYIPLKAGAKFIFAKYFYLSGELGASISTGNKVTNDVNNGHFAATSGRDVNSFAYSPGIGFEIPLSQKSSIDVGGRYEGWSNNGTFSFFGVRAAFNFGL